MFEEYIKTVISGIKMWVSSEINKTRTHWSETKLVPLVDNKELTFEDHDGVYECFYTSNAFTNVSSGDHLYVVFDDIEYDCVCEILDGIVFCGDRSILESGTAGEDAPSFSIIINPYELEIATLSTEQTHQISISMMQEIVHKLDVKYLPEDAVVTKKERTLWDQSASEIADHGENSDVHVTSSDKSLWNKHINTGDIHVTASNKSTWSNAASKLTTHMQNTTQHITSSERSDWSQTSSNFNSHKSDTSIHVLATDKDAWNKSVSIQDVIMPLPTNDPWGSVAYGDGKFVAVSSRTNTAAYSTDGITWTQTKTKSSNGIYSMTYGNGQFIGIDSVFGIAEHSTDGITWTQSNMPTKTGWCSVAYGDGKYVAFNRSSDIVAYSADGITWSITNLPRTYTKLEAVAYGDGKFVAIDVPTNIKSIGTIYSVDGVEWIASELPAALWKSVTYGDGKFVAVSSYSKIAAYSTDGITWTQTQMPTIAEWQTVTYGDGKFVAVSSYSKIAAYSTDGITWTQTQMPTIAEWQTVTYGDGKFVAVSSYSKIAAYSTDGITWNSETTKRLTDISGVDVTEQVEEIIDSSWKASSGLVISSSTSGSTKKFKITVNDSGTISATEVT